MPSSKLFVNANLLSQKCLVFNDSSILRFSLVHDNLTGTSFQNCKFRQGNPWSTENYSNSQKVDL